MYSHQNIRDIIRVNRNSEHKVPVVKMSRKVKSYEDEDDDGG